jgi:hypothetical protein
LTPNAQIFPRSLNTHIGGVAGDIYLIVADVSFLTNIKFFQTNHLTMFIYRSVPYPDKVLTLSTDILSLRGFILSSILLTNELDSPPQSIPMLNRTNFAWYFARGPVICFLFEGLLFITIF